MKRFLTLALALCLVLSSMLSLAACGRVTERDMEKDPYSTLDSAVDNTFTTFFTDDAGIEGILEKALKKGSFGLTVESDGLFGNDFEKLNATVYTDAKKDLLMADATLSYQGKEVSAFVWGDKDGVGVKSESLLGTADALYLGFDSFVEKFKGSALSDMMDVNDKDADEMLSAIKRVLDKVRMSSDKLEKDTREFMNKFYEALDQTVSTEEVTDADGDTAKQIVTTYSLTDTTLRAMLAVVKEELTSDKSLTAEEKASISEGIDDLIEDLDDSVDLNITLKIYILPKENRVTKITLAGKLSSTFSVGNIMPVDADEAEEEEDTPFSVDLNATMTFSANEIALHADIKVGGENMTADFSIKKETSKEAVTYKVSATMGMPSVTVNLLNATCTYEKKSGDLTVELDIMKTEAARNTVTIKANLAVEKDAFTLNLQSVKINKETTTFGKDNVISITVKALDTLPSIPANTKDVMNFTVQEWAEIFEHAGEVFVRRLSGSYSASLMGMEGSAFTLTFDGESDAVVLTTSLGSVQQKYTGTYTIEGDLIFFDFSQNDSFSGYFDFEDNGSFIVIDEATYRKVD